MSDRALVTGAAGWLGHTLVRELVASGRPVRALVMPNEQCDMLKILPDVEVVLGDVRNDADVEAFFRGTRGATLFHAAGVIHPDRVQTFYDVNLAGTQRVLTAAARSGVRRAIVVSSNSPIGVSNNLAVTFDENTPYRPYMNYGRSKMLMEQMIRRIGDSGAIETVIVRPPWFYGPNQPLRQTLFFRMVRDGSFPIVGDGSNRRSMVYIENLVLGMLLAESTPAARGGTFWIADEQPYTMNEIIATIRRLLREEFGEATRAQRIRLPAVAGTLATFADAMIQRMGCYNQKIHVLSEMDKTIACSITHAREVLGYEPPIALEEGMRRSLRWVYDHHGGLAS